jgi:hypothetical protein
MREKFGGFTVWVIRLCHFPGESCFSVANRIKISGCGWMTSDKKEDFIRRFRDLLDGERIPEKARPYYIRHLERWGTAVRHRPAGVDKKDFLEG